MKSAKPDLESDVANTATHAVGRPRVSVVVPGKPLPPIEIAPRRITKPRGPEPDSELFDIADVLDEVQPKTDADGRCYPRFANVPRSRERELELALKDQWTELSTRCIQIADLCNRQQQQAADLQTARQALSDLDKSVGLLQAALTQQESETAAAKEALAQAEQEKAALHAQLEAVQSDAGQSQQQARNLKAAFEERGAVLATARQKIETLAAELAAKTAEVETLKAPIDEERREHRAALMQQSARFETEVARLKHLLEEREQQLDTLQGAHTRVAKRYEELARSAEVLETAEKTARDHVKSQAELIQVLEALLKVERETAEGKAAELTAALEQERAARESAEAASATMRKDIVHLLPKLVARRNAAAAPQAETPAKREDAA